MNSWVEQNRFVTTVIALGTLGITLYFIKSFVTLSSDNAPKELIQSNVQKDDFKPLNDPSISSKKPEILQGGEQKATKTPNISLWTAIPSEKNVSNSTSIFKINTTYENNISQYTNIQTNATSEGTAGLWKGRCKSSSLQTPWYFQWLNPIQKDDIKNITVIKNIALDKSKLVEIAAIFFISLTTTLLAFGFKIDTVKYDFPEIIGIEENTLKPFNLSENHLKYIDRLAQDFKNFKKYTKWLSNHGKTWYKLTEEERNSEEYICDIARNKKKVFATDEKIYIKVKDYHDQLNAHLNKFFRSLKDFLKQQRSKDAQSKMTDLIIEAHASYDKLHYMLSPIIWTIGPSRIWERAQRSRDAWLSYQNDQDVNQYTCN